MIVFFKRKKRYEFADRNSESQREREEGLSMMWPTVQDSNGVTAEFTNFFVIFLSVFQVVFTEHVSLFFLNKCTISDRPIWASTTGTQEMFVDFFLFSFFFFFF